MNSVNEMWQTMRMAWGMRRSDAMTFRRLRLAPIGQDSMEMLRSSAPGEAARCKGEHGGRLKKRVQPTKSETRSSAALRLRRGPVFGVLFLIVVFAYASAMAIKTLPGDRNIRRVGVCLSLLAMPLLACSGEEQKRQLAELQKKSDDRVAQVERQSKEQIAGLEKQIEALKIEAAETAAKAKSDVDVAVAKAQASVDDAEKEAAAALKKARDAYRTEAKSRYASLNKELADVTAKAQKVPAKTKAAYDKAIQDVLNLQKEISKDLSAYDKATLDTLGKTKAKMDVDLAKYKNAIKAAKAKIPA